MQSYGGPWRPPVANIGAAAPQEVEGHDGPLAVRARKALPMFLCISVLLALSQHLIAGCQRMRAIELAHCAALGMPQVIQRLCQIPAMAQHLSSGSGS